MALALRQTHFLFFSELTLPANGCSKKIGKNLLPMSTLMKERALGFIKFYPLFSQEILDHVHMHALTDIKEGVV